MVIEMEKRNGKGRKDEMGKGERKSKRRKARWGPVYDGQNDSGKEKGENLIKYEKKGKTRGWIK